MHRFFLPPENIILNQVIFPPDIARQIVAVLRLSIGQHVVVLDNHGLEYEVEITSINGKEVKAIIHEKRSVKTELGASLSLYLCLSQREKFEWMLQKCTEVGAAQFIPVISSRNLVQKADGVKSKFERWQHILREAAEQSGRGKIPTLSNVLSYEQAVADAKGTNLALIPWEGEKTKNIRDAMSSLDVRDQNNQTHIAVMIGPEGGFAVEEIELAVRSGWHPVTLGPRTLRMETAAVVAAALVAYEFETGFYPT